MLKQIQAYADDGVLYHRGCGGEIEATISETLFQCSVSFPGGGDGSWDIGEGIYADINTFDHGGSENTLLYLECSKCGEQGLEIQLMENEDEQDGLRGFVPTDRRR
jgi:hypothetical protein